MPIPRTLSAIGHPRLAVVTGIGAVVLLLTAIMTLGTVGSGLLRFRLGVIGYLCVLGGGAGYIALGVADRLDPD